MLRSSVYKGVMLERRFNKLKNVYLGGRVLKTALAVAVAVSIAQALGLERVTLTAIVAVVTVQKTFYHSLLQSIAKVGSVLMGALLGTSLGALFGNNPITFAVVTILSIIFCLRLKWQEQIPITLVTAVHMISFPGGSFQVLVFMEQIFLAFIGAVSALGVNYFFTPNHNQELQSKIKEIDLELRNMLDDISLKILNPENVHDGAISERSKRLREKINQAMDMSKLFREEQKFHFTDETLGDKYRALFRSFDYFLENIEEMYRLLKRMRIAVPQAKYLAKLLRILNKTQENALKGKNIHYTMIEQGIEDLERFYENMELPTSRDEFVSRASLFHVFREIKQYFRRIKDLPRLTPKKGKT